MQQSPTTGTGTGTDVHVIGGGLGGLAAAAFVARSGRSVTVHEQRGRLGGRATTDERDGYRFNQGPHALYVGGEGASVLEALGVRPAGRAPATRRARMARDRRTFLAPGGPLSLVGTRLLGTRDKIELATVLRRLHSLQPAAVADRTVAMWVDSVIERPAVAQVIHAVIRLATYVNAPDDLSAEVAVQQVQRALSPGVVYLDGGWGRLVDRLSAGVTRAGGTIVIGDGADRLPDAAAVIVAVGGPATTSRIVGEHIVAGPESCTSILDLALDRPPEHRFVIGVDEPIYLADHGFPAGMTPGGAASVSLANYLAPGVEPDRERLRSFARHAGITSSRVVDERYLHRMATVTSIATAATGGLAGRPPVTLAERPGVYLVGDWVGPRGHLADAVLSSAREAARLAIDHLDRRPVAR